ncbi:hypothetical protein KIN20_033020 [Parelaphostrongylus tenuis]|uniref:Uncharacterized protein n=1 Tax=Parelaphostrongylus tenuis TaxID=148309 RepID=A0AAD5WHX1_PARTN|nr:hypothetical protein KIN20_033020 [Parelaphostrongylus tenuis]
MEEIYNQAQDGSEDEDDIPTKKLRKTGRFRPRDEKRKEHVIPTNFSAPSGNLFPENSFHLVYEKFWVL